MGRVRDFHLLELPAKLATHPSDVPNGVQVNFSNVELNERTAAEVRAEHGAPEC